MKWQMVRDNDIPLLGHHQETLDQKSFEDLGSNALKQ